MHRLDRRMIVLRGKRQGAFDTNQYYFEKSERTRQMRRTRVIVRTGTPVVVVTPRWTNVASFLDDLAVDLALGEPCIKARSLGLHSLKGLTVHQAWAWIASAVAEFCQITMLDGAGAGRPLWQAVSRRGFREVLGDLLRRAEGGRRRCLMIHGLEHAHVEAVQDLLEVFGEHVQEFGPERVVNFLFAGAVDAPYLEFEGAERLKLSDYAHDEAIEVLVEHLGPVPQHRLESVIKVIGGVPALVETLGASSKETLVELLMDRETIWNVLGGLGDEIRSALDIANADAALSSRLERLARLGALQKDPLDTALSRAGLVTFKASRSGITTSIRSPWFADLVLSS